MGRNLCIASASTVDAGLEKESAMELSIPVSDLLSLSARDLKPVRFSPAGRILSPRRPKAECLRGGDGASLTDRLALEHAILLQDRHERSQCNAAAYRAPWFASVPPANTG